METLIQNLIKNIQISFGIDSKEARIKAFREVILSGLSRGNLLKKCPYLPEFDHYLNGNLYLFFLDTGDLSGAFLNEAKKFINIESEAAGAEITISEKNNGLLIETDGMNINISVVCKEYDLSHLITYHHNPLAYELYSIDAIPNDLHSELQKMIGKQIHKDVSGGNKKRKQLKNAVKDKEKNKSNIQQLSLFDF